MSVFSQGCSVIHQGDGGVHVTTGPTDVCKVPAPPAPPVPTPFPNSAPSALLVNGARKSFIQGTPVALKKSKLAVSTGDEPGVALGVVSSKVKGALTFLRGSPVFKVEGQPVVRFLDNTGHNCGSVPNTVSIANGKPAP